MIIRAQAEGLAARWARGESEQRGYVCEPAIEEFEHGFVIWTRQPPTVLPVPGDGARTVIDRATGALSTWPAVPVADIAGLYRDHRPPPPATVDPSVTLLRLLRRSPSPTTAARITANGRPIRAQGAKGDQTINHHPLVRAHLDALPAGLKVRGAERHAELIALSEALHESGRQTLDEARSWLITAQFEAHAVRDHDDPEAGEAARPCETCLAALVDFALLPWSDLAYVAERRPSAAAPRGRFPREAAEILAAGGWTGRPSSSSGRQVAGEAGRPRGETAAEWGGSRGESGRPSAEVGRPSGASTLEMAVEAGGGRLTAFPAAERVIAEFAGVRSGRRGPGRRRAIRPLALDPVAAAASARALTDFAEALGEQVFPLGTEGGDTLLAIDERGRIFALDQAGEWFIGETWDEALTGLLTGDGPARRLRDDNSW